VVLSPSRRDVINSSHSQKHPNAVDSNLFGSEKVNDSLLIRSIFGRRLRLSIAAFFDRWGWRWDCTKRNLFVELGQQTARRWSSFEVIRETCENGVIKCGFSGRQHRLNKCRVNTSSFRFVLLRLSSGGFQTQRKSVRTGKHQLSHNISTFTEYLNKTLWKLMHHTPDRLYDHNLNENETQTSVCISSKSTMITEISENNRWQEIPKLYCETGRLNRTTDRVDRYPSDDRLATLSIPSIPFYLFCKSLFHFALFNMC
jgi:hypothetical protein